MMEPGLQHTVCGFLLPFFILSLFFFFRRYRRSLMLSDKVRYSFFSGAFICEIVVL